MAHYADEGKGMRYYPEDFHSLPYFADVIDGEDYPRMDSTGIRDKKGVEVYEGDIIYDDTVEQRGIIKYGEFYKDVDGYGHHGTFTGYHVEYIGEGDGTLPYDSLYCAGMSMEVIGNIFEHPHLLEGEPKQG